MRRSPLLALLALCLAACAGLPKAERGDAMVAAADPRAADAGAQMIKAGGSSTDAAIAAMAVLGLVEPQSAGVGGGGFLLHFENSTNAIVAYDGREKAPKAATPDMFLGPDGKPLPFPVAVTSGRSTGAPSLYAMLKLAHEEHGKLPWANLFEPAIKLAEDGFVVSPRLNMWITNMIGMGGLSADPVARAYFTTEDGKPLPVGFVRKNPEYAATLIAIATEGPEALKAGPIAEAIVAKTHAEPIPGSLSLEDLQAVQPRKLEAVCGVFRMHEVCGLPPPSSGGTTVIDILGLYARARPTPGNAANVDDWAAFIWASRLAYTDRDYYLADDEFVPVPTKGLVDPRYLDVRAKPIDLTKAAPTFIEPGDPSAAVGGESLIDKWGRQLPPKESGTTHMSIVDHDGDAVALTATIEAPFGSQRMTNGFLLNNQLTDFSRAPTLNGKPVANAVAAGKRPRSSISPTFVLDQHGELEMIAGSPGGSSIIAYVAKTLIGALDWNLSTQQAIDLPNAIATDAKIRVEENRMSAETRAALTERGWTLVPMAGEDSGVQAIRVTPQGLDGGADPRREGVARLIPLSK